MSAESKPRFRDIAGRPVQIGRDYWPNPTLRQMPRHWHLEGTGDPKRWHFWRSGDAWVGAAAAIGLFWICVEVIKSALS